MLSKISFSGWTSKDIITPPCWIAKILKIPVFRISLGNDLVSRVFIAVHNFFSRLCSSHSFHSFDPVIAQKSIDRFVALGAKIDFVTPRDEKGKVQMMTFQAQELEQKIKELGGSWEQRIINKREVFAIIPPPNETQTWTNFKEKLSHFHWKEEQDMLITCDCADLIPQDAEKQCFLFAHSTSESFSRNWKRAGFYLGAKQDLCFFDNGNTWKNSGRPPSEESFYLEIEAVYNNIKANYKESKNIWVGGSCGGAPVAAYLKKCFHEQGINFFVEQSFSNLNDFVKPISSVFAPLVKGSLKSTDLPLNMKDRPPSCQFSVDKLWEKLPLYNETDSKGGKFILIQVKNDEHISKLAYEHYLTLAHKVSKKVTHILFESSINYRHADEFFRYDQPRYDFVKAVFK